MSIDVSAAAYKIQQNLSLLRDRWTVNSIRLVVFQEIFAKRESIEMRQDKDDDESEKLVGAFAHLHVNFLEWIVLSNNLEILVELKKQLWTWLRLAVIQLLCFQLKQQCSGIWKIISIEQSEGE